MIKKRKIVFSSKVQGEQHNIFLHKSLKYIANSYKSENSTKLVKTKKQKQNQSKKKKKEQKKKKQKKKKKKYRNVKKKRYSIGKKKKKKQNEVLIFIRF